MRCSMSGSFASHVPMNEVHDRARLFALRTEHVAVDHKRLLVAEQVSQCRLAALAFELDSSSSRRRPAATRGAVRRRARYGGEARSLPPAIARGRGDTRRSRWECGRCWRGQVRQRVSGLEPDMGMTSRLGGVLGSVTRRSGTANPTRPPNYFRPSVPQDKTYALLQFRRRRAVEHVALRPLQQHRARRSRSPAARACA